MEHLDIYKWAREVRRDFHMHPELGTKEHRTASKIEEYLEDMGIEYQRVADTGIVGIIKGKSSGKTIALRADIDALPIKEVEGRSYRSKVDGVMHACGHDAHTAILLGAAKVLSGMKEEISGNIKLFFQPAEETVGGAERMIAEGVMEGVDLVIGLHVMTTHETGIVEVKYGKLNASSDTIKLTIKGSSSHGAYPHMGVDAIVIAGSVISSLQSIVSRNVSPNENVVVSFGKINGGTQGNIVADKVELTGTLRTTNEKVRKTIKERIISIVEGVSSSMGGEGIVEIEPGYMSLTNTDEVVKIVEESARELLGEENIVYKELPSLGVEDFSFFIEAAKDGGAFYHLGCASESKGIKAAAHNEKFDIDEDCIEIGINLQVKNVLKLLQK